MSAAQLTPGPLPAAPLYAFFMLPRGLLLKVHAEPSMYAPGYLQSFRPRWPGAALAKASKSASSHYRCTHCGCLLTRQYWEDIGDVCQSCVARARETA